MKCQLIGLHHMSRSPARLKRGYRRAIIGFDLRAVPSYTPPRSEIQWLGSWFDTARPRLSADQFVWTRFWEPIEESDFAPFGLAYTPDVLNSGIKTTSLWALHDSVLVAFDMPVSWIEWRMGSLAGITDLSDIPTEFKFSGFDVVDSWFIDGSGLYSFDRSKEDMLKIMAVTKGDLNSLGLIDDEEAALRAARYFSKKIPDHAPFSPCGIWLGPIVRQ